MTWEGREILCFLYPEDEDPGEDDAENVDEGQGQADQKQNPNIVIQARINNFGESPPPPLSTGMGYTESHQQIFG